MTRKGAKPRIQSLQYILIDLDRAHTLLSHQQRRKHVPSPASANNKYASIVSNLVNNILHVVFEIFNVFWLFPGGDTSLSSRIDSEMQLQHSPVCRISLTQSFSYHRSRQRWIPINSDSRK